MGEPIWCNVSIHIPPSWWPDSEQPGRSNWFWLRTPSNDLMLCCFPRGDLGYYGSELDWGRN